MLRITFLGTASSRPTVKRNVSGLALQRAGNLFLFDCGEGTQRQMMRYGVGFSVEQIFITHLHADHYLGLPGLFRTMNLQAREAPIVVWGPVGSSGTLRDAVELGGDRMRFPVSIRELPAGESVKYDGFVIKAYETDHRAESVGYVLKEDSRLGRFDVKKARSLGVQEGPMFGRLHRGEAVEGAGGRIVSPEEVVGPRRRGRTVVYTGDTRPSEQTVAEASEADLLIHEATFAEEEAARARETKHSTAREAAQMAAKAGVRRLVLTHFSARYSEQADRLAAEAAEIYPAAEAASDGMTVEVDFPDPSSGAQP
ncbi:MAG: ribonuclease Z [Gemmatimonadota bacterium]